jgi:hypothetical protein
VRPKSIVYFEILLLGTLALGVVQSLLAWNDTTKLAGIGFTLIVQITTLAIFLALTLLISRGRNRIAMWISIALFVLGLPAYFAILSKGLLFGSGAISLAQIIGELVGYGMLFTPSARAWLSRKQVSTQPDPA